MQTSDKNYTHYKAYFMQIFCDVKKWWCAFFCSYIDIDTTAEKGILLHFNNEIKLFKSYLVTLLAHLFLIISKADRNHTIYTNWLIMFFKIQSKISCNRQNMSNISYLSGKFLQCCPLVTKEYLALEILWSHINYKVVLFAT